MRYRNVFIAALALTLWTAGVEAQATIPSGIEVKIGSTEIDEAPQYLYVNKANCDRNDSITFTIGANGLGDSSQLEVWTNPAATPACSEPAGRNPGNGTDPPCKQAYSETVENNETRTFSVKAQDLFGDGEKCQDAKAFYVYIMGLAAASSDAATNVAAKRSYTVRFTVDTAAPGAPGSPKGGEGETQVNVSFRPASGLTTGQINSYKVFVDKSAIRDAAVGDCSSTKLVAGDPAPSDDDADVKVFENEQSPVTVNPMSIDGFAEEQTIPAAVVAVDGAGNQGPLSKTVCIKYVLTDGFWDSCTGDCREDFEQCSASQPSRKPLALSMLTVLALATLLVVRRRRIS